MLSVSVRRQLRDFALDVEFALEGEPCVVLIGPTGCGKSMTLRSIAGLERPDWGRIVCGDRVVFDSDKHVNVPPERRHVGMVFQDYALFPHMTVLENVLYGPLARKVAPAYALHSARTALSQLAIDRLAGERPDRLSGGQRQRVALARALASQPAVLLLDEPMSALDTQTRRKVRFELRALIERIGIPTVAVTHDPEDALTLGDRICVMLNGTIIQSGDRRELTQRPRSDFLAEFMGLNLFRGMATPVDDETSELAYGDTKLRAKGAVRGPACVTVRPSDVRIALARPAPPTDAVAGTVTSLSYTGQAVRATIENESAVIYCEMTGDEADRLHLSPGVAVFASFDPLAAICYEETGTWLS